MTGLDTVVVVLAIIQVVAIALMVFAGLSMMDTAKRGRRAFRPTVAEARALAQAGKTIVDHSRTHGTAAASRIKAVTNAVKRRFETTTRIVKELKPGASEAATGIQAKRESAVKTVGSVAGLARGLGRVKAAADSAVTAARTESPS